MLMLYIFIFIFFIGLIILLYFILRIGNKVSSPILVVPTGSNVNLNSTFGESANGIVKYQNASSIQSSTVCNSTPTANWFAGKCYCQVPFFGDSCQYEAVDNTYYDVGTLVGGFAGATSDVNRLSFKFTYNVNSPFSNDQTECTQVCDSTPGCSGVYYYRTGTQGIKDADSVCGLIINDLQNPQLAFSSNSQGNVFYKKPYAPVFTDRAFIFYNILPERYWVISTEQSATLFLNNTYPTLINFYNTAGRSTFPNYVKSDSPGFFYFGNTVANATPPTDLPSPPSSSGLVSQTTTQYVYYLVNPGILQISFYSSGWNAIYAGFYN